MFPTFFPSKDKLKDDVAQVTNLCYYAPLDTHRRQGDWCTETVNGDHPRAYHRDGREYTGQGPTWAARIQDLVLWLDQQPTAPTQTQAREAE